MIKFGVAGYPLAFSESPFKKDKLKVFEWLRAMNLDAFEAQMTYGPRTSKENCLAIKQAAADQGISISVHASYFIVFTSNDKQKISQSIDTLQRTYELASILNSDIIVLHPGPLYGIESSIISKRLEDNLSLFFDKLGTCEIGLFLETAGKRGQFGSVQEVLDISDKFSGCFPCIDFGHVHARTGGTLNNNAGIDELFSSLNLKKAFSKEGRIHFHYTPIHYGPKGEITHKALHDRIEKSSQLAFELLKTSDDMFHPRFERIIESLLPLDLSSTIISEAHNSQEVAASEMSRYYRQHLTLV